MHKFGNVKEITWDVNTFDSLPWKRKPFNNKEQITAWREQGFTHENFTGEMVDASTPGEIPSWAWQLARAEFDLENITISMYRMQPGDIIPEHSDTYALYRKIYNIDDPAVIWRGLVMLNNWESGHYLEINGVAEVNWAAGNTFTWHNDTPHMAANLGKTPRYTLQVTGMKK